MSNDIVTLGASRHNGESTISGARLSWPSSLQSIAHRWGWSPRRPEITPLEPDPVHPGV